jgi:hypothetical protein
LPSSPFVYVSFKVRLDCFAPLSTSVVDAKSRSKIYRRTIKTLAPKFVSAPVGAHMLNEDNGLKGQKSAASDSGRA